MEIIVGFGASGLTIFLAWVFHELERRFISCRDNWLYEVNEAFEHMQARRLTYLSCLSRHEAAWNVYNFDKFILPFYRMTNKVAWRMVFRRKWKHLLTGKQRFLMRIKEPAYVPHLTVAMYHRKPWKVWSHPGMFHDVKVISMQRSNIDQFVIDRAFYQGVKHRGANFTWPSELLPTGMNPRRKTD